MLCILKGFLFLAFQYGNISFQKFFKRVFFTIFLTFKNRIPVYTFHTPGNILTIIWRKYDSLHRTLFVSNSQIMRSSVRVYFIIYLESCSNKKHMGIGLKGKTKGMFFFLCIWGTKFSSIFCLAFIIEKSRINFK